MKKEARNVVIGAIVGVIALVVVIMLIMSIAIVPAGKVGVHDLFGKVDENEFSAGFHFKNPLANVHMMSIQTQEYTMSYAQGEGAKYGSDVISALTKEGLSVDLDITILYKMTPQKADVIYKTIGENYVTVIVRPQIRTVIREVIAEYEAKQIYSSDRTVISLAISEKLEPDLSKRGIILESVLLRHVELPAELTIKITEKLQAEQEAERMEFVLQRETQEANRKRIEAQGIADANTIISGSITPEYLRWYFIQMIPEYNATTFIPVGDDGIPFVKVVE